MSRKKFLGFTLIELLVVISIIGFLTTVAVVSLNSSRQKARDARRKSDLEQARKALLLYANDHSGALPVSGFGWNNAGNGWATNRTGGTVCYSYGDLEDILDGSDAGIPSPVNNYLQMGHDPKCGGCSGCGSTEGGYMYYHLGSCATLFAHLEQPTATDTASCTGTCVSIPGYGMNYCVNVKP